MARAIQGASTDSVASKKSQTNESESSNWKVKMLYDGDCPLCMREVCLYLFSPVQVFTCLILRNAPCSVEACVRAYLNF